jgi:hypothetical protein
LSDSAKEAVLSNKDYRVLQAMKSVLLDIIKDTTVEPGVRHPLSDSTIENLRQVLALIYAREHEIADEHGFSMKQKPYYTDELQTSPKVSLDDLLAQKNQHTKKK